MKRKTAVSSALKQCRTVLNVSGCTTLRTMMPNSTAKVSPLNCVCNYLMHNKMLQQTTERHLKKENDAWWLVTSCFTDPCFTGPLRLVLVTESHLKGCEFISSALILATLTYSSTATSKLVAYKVFIAPNALKFYQLAVGCILVNIQRMLYVNQC